MANEETIKGIAKAVRKDKKGILIGEKWYSNKFMKETEAKKGDEVEVTLNEKGYLDTVKILTSAPTSKPNDYNAETRKLVDSGNILERATELTTAVIEKGVTKEELPVLFDSAVTECLKQFKRIHKGLTETEEDTQ